MPEAATQVHVQVEVRPSAMDQVRRLMAGQTNGVAVRIYAQPGGGGCCGGGSAVQFGMAFAKPRRDDEVVKDRRLLGHRRPDEHPVRQRGCHRLRGVARGIRASRSPTRRSPSPTRPDWRAAAGPAVPAPRTAAAAGAARPNGQSRPGRPRPSGESPRLERSIPHPSLAPRHDDGGAPRPRCPQDVPSRGAPNVDALSGVSLVVHPGERVALLGRNGAGQDDVPEDRLDPARADRRDGRGVRPRRRGPPRRGPTDDRGRPAGRQAVLPPHAPGTGVHLPAGARLRQGGGEVPDRGRARTDGAPRGRRPALDHALRGAAATDDGRDRDRDRGAPPLPR